MGEWKKICCAIDFSDESRFAMEKAADLARTLEATLTLVHVREPLLPGEIDLLGPAGEHIETTTTHLERMMATWRSEAARRAGARIRSSVRLGEAAAEIPRFAREEAMDLIVVGARGHTGLRQLLLGPLSERIARESPCPVLVACASRAEAGS